MAFALSVLLSSTNSPVTCHTHTTRKVMSSMISGCCPMVAYTEGIAWKRMHGKTDCLQTRLGICGLARFFLLRHSRRYTLRNAYGLEYWPGAGGFGSFGKHLYIRCLDLFDCTSRNHSDHTAPDISQLFISKLHALHKRLGQYI